MSIYFKAFMFWVGAATLTAAPVTAQESTPLKFVVANEQQVIIDTLAPYCENGGCGIGLRTAPDACEGFFCDPETDSILRGANQKQWDRNGYGKNQIEISVVRQNLPIEMPYVTGEVPVYFTASTSGCAVSFYGSLIDSIQQLQQVISGKKENCID